MRKAFESVPHDLFIFYFRCYGVIGKNIKWIRNFFSGTQPQVVINEKISLCIPIISGVPQDGVLSGLMFILYMNDLPNVL